MNFKLGTALAALEDIGNLAFNLRITGGKYGIITTRTSPNWQFVLMDSIFENQSVAGVKTKDVGFSLHPLQLQPHARRHRHPRRRVRPDLRPRPPLREHHQGRRRIRRPQAPQASGHPRQHRLHRCAPVPRQRPGKDPGSRQVLRRRSPLRRPGNRSRRPRSRHRHPSKRSARSRPPPRWFPPTSRRCLRWTSGSSPHAAPDFQTAINEHRVLYFPMGTYRGERPRDAQVRHRPDRPALHETPPSAPSLRPRAGRNLRHRSGLQWRRRFPPTSAGMSGEKSAWMTSPSAAVRRWPRRCAAGRWPAHARRRPTYFLVNDGGGGIIRNLWVEGGAPAGMRVENTSTPGKIYQLSNEHHNRVEVVFRNVAELGNPLPPDRGGVGQPVHLLLGHRGLQEPPVRQHLHVPRLPHRPAGDLRHHRSATPTTSSSTTCTSSARRACRLTTP